ncbi:MAG TPA: iron transporter [Nocardioidaceae bacterium]|nr:iron transporter [Nocardioidaceae bacterium]
MRLPVTLLAAVPLVALSACAATDGSAAPADVPDGVAEQYATLAAEIEERGGEVESGPWTIGYIVERAEPWFEGPEKTSFREPDAEATHHIEVIPTETATGRIVPDVPITVEIVDADGNVVDSARLNFLHSTFFHYANNFRVPEEGRYSLRVTLEPPTFFRHGEAGEEPPLAEPATVTFEDVELGTE